MLLVDDSPMIRPLIREILRGSNWHIIEANGAEQALERASNHSGGLDLLVTDFTLPGKNGFELAAELSLRYPALKVLCMSGYALPPAETQGMGFIEKPFRPDALLRKIQEICPI